MTNPTQQTTFGKVLTAFGVFIAVVIVALTITVARQAKKVDTAPATADVTLESADEDVYYDSVGTSDISEDEAVDGMQNDMNVGQDRFTLELKVADSREEAEKSVESFSAKGIEAYYTPLLGGGRVVYRVRQGMYDDEKTAADASEKLRLAKNIESSVVKMQ